MPEPPLPSRRPATCAPEPHRFNNDQPLSHGDTRHGTVDPRIRYLLPIALSPDGRELAGSYRDAVVVWDTATGEVARVLATASWTDVLAWSPDGVEIVTEDADGLTRLDASCGFGLGSYQGHERRVSVSGAARRVSAAVFAPDGRRLLSIGADRTLRAWSVADGAELGRVWVDDPVAITISPDGSTVVVTSGNGTTTRYAVRDLVRSGSFESAASRWRFVDDRTLIGGSAATVVTRSVAGGVIRELFTVGGEVRDVASSPDGKLAVALTADAGAWLAPLRRGTAIQLERPEYYGGAISSACFAPDGATVYVCDQVTGIVAYSSKGAVVRRFTAPKS